MGWRTWCYWSRSRSQPLLRTSRNDTSMTSYTYPQSSLSVIVLQAAAAAADGCCSFTVVSPSPLYLSSPSLATHTHTQHYVYISDCVCWYYLGIRLFFILFQSVIILVSQCKYPRSVQPHPYTDNVHSSLTLHVTLYQTRQLQQLGSVLYYLRVLPI